MSLTLSTSGLKSLRRLVAKHFQGAKLLSHKKLTGGVSAEVTKLSLQMGDGSEHDVVLREHGLNHDGHPVELEFQILKALHKSALKVPRPIAYETTKTVLSNHFLLLEWVEGCVKIPGHSANIRLEQMADYLREIHQTRIPALANLHKLIDPVAELLAVLQASSRWDDLCLRLRRLKDMTYRDDHKLLHGDFWQGNVIWNMTGEIAAVIDWEDASLGDPVFDVASACLELEYSYGLEGAMHFHSRYAKHMDLDPFRFALWKALAGAHAGQNMGNWNLEPRREEHMRRIATAAIEELAELVQEQAAGEN